MAPPNLQRNLSFVLWEAVSQAKHSCSPQIKIFGPHKILGRLHYCLTWPNLTLVEKSLDNPARDERLTCDSMPFRQVLRISSIRSLWKRFVVFTVKTTCDWFANFNSSSFMHGAASPAARLPNASNKVPMPIRPSNGNIHTITKIQQMQTRTSLTRVIKTFLSVMILITLIFSYYCPACLPD